MTRDVLKIVEELNLQGNYWGIPELKIIEDHLKDYQIVLYDNNPKLHKPIYYNKNRTFLKYIYIIYSQDEKHYDVILSMKRLLDRSYYCDLCKIGYNQLGDHKCSNTCSFCYRYGCKLYEKIKCMFCFKNCNNETCVRFHQENFCFKVKNCSVCNRRKTSKHVCNSETWCFNCKKSVPQNHLCYILTDDQTFSNNKTKKEVRGYIFFDYEAYRDSEGMHIPNLWLKKFVQAVKTQNLDVKNVRIKLFFMIMIVFVVGYFNNITLSQLLII